MSSFLPSTVVEAAAQQLSTNATAPSTHGSTQQKKPAARIIVHSDGRESLANGEPLYTHPAVRQRAMNSPYALHDACEAGDLLFVKAFFQAHPNDRNPMRDLAALERRDLYSQTPVHIALLNGRYEIGKILLANGASPLATLEGTPQLHILLTLCGSFPQFQIPLLQPTEQLLTKAVEQLKSTAANNNFDIHQLTPHSIIKSAAFPHLQSYLVRSLHLWLDKLASWPKDVYRKDDNGRNLFHLCAEYDLQHALIVLAERLFYSPTVAEYIEATNETKIFPAEGLGMVKRRKIFARSILAQDNLKRNVFHYCAQYRSFHALKFFCNLIKDFPEFFPCEFKCTSLTDPSAVSLGDLLDFQDRYHRSPLHFAYYHAAPFYSRDPALKLRDLLGHYEGRGVAYIVGDNSHEHFIKNKAIISNDPIVKAFVEFQMFLTDSLHNNKYDHLLTLLGTDDMLDIYKRNPYQHGVFNQPIFGHHNAGTIPTASRHQLTQPDTPFDLNATVYWNPHPTFKPTLIGWSPRCFEHHTAGKITRKEEAPPPENVRRLQVLLNFTDGILRSNNLCRRVQTTDILALNALYYNTIIAQLIDVNNGTPDAHFDIELNKTVVNSSSYRPNLGDSKSIISKDEQLFPVDEYYQSTPLIPQQILHWHHRSPRATFADVLRCHDFSYITKLMSATEAVPEQGDWSVASLESIDLLHRDLHITVPTITTGSLAELKKQHSTSMEFYQNVLKNAFETSILPHNAFSSNVTSGNTADLIRQRGKQGVIQSPVSSIAQAILYRERSMLNLNFGYTTLCKYDNHGRTTVSKNVIQQDLNNIYANSNVSGNEKDQLMQQAANDMLDQNPELLFLADGYEQQFDQKLALLNGAGKLPRVNVLVEEYNTKQWRSHLTSAAYTNSLIQSSSLLHLVYHYPNYQFITSANNNDSTITQIDDCEDDDDAIIMARERTTTYSYEIDAMLAPAPHATRHTVPPVPLRNLDEDTSVSSFSWFAALYAGGTVIDAVKRVLSGQYKNAFCAVRPPGHHSGPTGLVSTDENIGDSHGFCLLNNITLGAAHAKALFPDMIKRVAIIDFDVHHGNGTEAIVQKLRPQLLQRTIHIPQSAASVGVDKLCLTRQVYSPWSDSQDVDEVLFASVHGYHKAAGDQFYPGTGSTTDGIIDAINENNKNPYRIIAQTPELTEQQAQMFSTDSFTSRAQTLDALKKFFFQRENPGLITANQSADPHHQIEPSANNILVANKTPYVSPITVDLQYDGDAVAAKKASLYNSLTIQQGEQVNDSDISNNVSTFNVSIYPGDLPSDLPIHQIIESRPHRILNAGLGKHTRPEWRKIWQHTIIPGIVAHNPDLIMISAGFDAHHRDKINGGHVGIDEDDYYWITKQLMKVANLCCEGRIVSCLEGGYRIHGGLVSPFARSVAAHVRALHEGGNDSWTPDDVDVELEIMAESMAEKELQWTIKQSEGSRIVRRDDEVRAMNIEAQSFLASATNNSNPTPDSSTSMNDGPTAPTEENSSARPSRARKPTSFNDPKLLRKLDTLDNKNKKQRQPTTATSTPPQDGSMNDADQLVNLSEQPTTSEEQPPAP